MSTSSTFCSIVLISSDGDGGDSGPVHRGTPAHPQSGEGASGGLLRNRHPRTRCQAQAFLERPPPAPPFPRQLIFASPRGADACATRRRYSVEGVEPTPSCRLALRFAPHPRMLAKRRLCGADARKKALARRGIAPLRTHPYLSVPIRTCPIRRGRAEGGECNIRSDVHSLSDTDSVCDFLYPQCLH